MTGQEPLHSIKGWQKEACFGSSPPLD
uniref:Uncharacterized protein n=1 Tax=Anguilla anguilla TaxID=7936 RepID=A0A0E9TM97_ANGAN